MENAEAIYLGDQGVTGHEVRQVCPATTTTYELRVIAQEREFKRTVTISVGGPRPADEPTILFWAERTEIAAGECTDLHWDVENAQAIYLNGQGVTGHEILQVCPVETTTYELLVTAPGLEVKRTVTIAVVLPQGKSSSQ